MTTQDEAVVCGMFLYEGYRDYLDCKGDDPCDFVGGAIEQAEFLAFWADHIAGTTRLWLMEHPQEDHPGVLAYEVWAPMGWWLAERMDNGETFEKCAYLGIDPRDGSRRTRRPYNVVDAVLEARLESFFGVQVKGEDV